MSSIKEIEILSNVIEVYRDMPYLWQKEDKNYTNKKMRNEGINVLLNIYKDFDEYATEQTIKKKIENMRTTYVRELKKVMSSIDSGARKEDVYKPSLWYFDAFHFLGYKNKYCQELKDPFEEEFLQTSQSSDDEFSYVSTTKNSAQKRKKQDTLETRRVKLETLSRFESAEKFTKNEADWEIYGKSIGHQLKDLDKRQLIICQKLISDVIFYAKLNRLTEEAQIVLPNNIEIEQSNFDDE